MFKIFNSSRFSNGVLVFPADMVKYAYLLGVFSFEWQFLPVSSPKFGHCIDLFTMGVLEMKRCARKNGETCYFFRKSYVI